MLIFLVNVSDTQVTGGEVEPPSSNKVKDTREANSIKFQDSNNIAEPEGGGKSSFQKPGERSQTSEEVPLTDDGSEELPFLSGSYEWKDWVFATVSGGGLFLFSMAYPAYNTLITKKAMDKGSGNMISLSSTATTVCFYFLFTVPLAIMSLSMLLVSLKYGWVSRTLGVGVVLSKMTGLMLVKAVAGPSAIKGLFSRSDKARSGGDIPVTKLLTLFLDVFMYAVSHYLVIIQSKCHEIGDSKCLSEFGNMSYVHSDPIPFVIMLVGVFVFFYVYLEGEEMNSKARSIISQAIIGSVMEWNLGTQLDGPVVAVFAGLIGWTTHTGPKIRADIIAGRHSFLDIITIVLIGYRQFLQKDKTSAKKMHEEYLKACKTIRGVPGTAQGVNHVKAVYVEFSILDLAKNSSLTPALQSVNWNDKHFWVLTDLIATKYFKGYRDPTITANIRANAIPTLSPMVQALMNGTFKNCCRDSTGWKFAETGWIGMNFMTFVAHHAESKGDIPATIRQMTNRILERPTGDYSKVLLVEGFPGISGDVELTVDNTYFYTGSELRNPTQEELAESWAGTWNTFRGKDTAATGATIGETERSWNSLATVSSMQGWGVGGDVTLYTWMKVNLHKMVLGEKPASKVSTSFLEVGKIYTVISEELRREMICSTGFDWSSFHEGHKNMESDTTPDQVICVTSDLKNAGFVASLTNLATAIP